MKMKLLQLKRIYTLIPLLFFLSINLQAQSTISGTVSSSDDGEFLPGVSILIKGTSTGSITDLNGNFKIQANTGDILQFSYIGFQSYETVVGTQTTLDIKLLPDLEQLEEVVVIGYGTQKKSDLTGAIAGVDSEVINERGVTNPIQSLQGSIAGVQITNSSGRVGDGFDVTIRGKNTLNSGATEPLYVVDGTIVDNIDFLNPQDIAKIDVLKDASSAAIYGSRGSNGVLLIQTKGGVHVPEGTNISFESFYGFKDPARLPEMMGLEKWRDYHLSAYLATINPSKVTTPEEFYDAVVSPGSNRVLRNRFETLDGYDWYDGVLQSGRQSNNHLSINHRNGGSAYSIGLGYQNETGNIENESLDKYTLRSSIDQEIGKKIKTGGSISVSLSNIQRGSQVAMREAFRLNPFLKPWDIDENDQDIVGKLFPQPGKLTDVNGDFVINKTSTYNPLLEIANSKDETRQWNGIGNVYLQYKPMDWLSFKTSFSAGLENYRRGKSWGAQTNTGVSNNNLPSSEIDYYENFNFSWDNQMDISKRFNDHSINFLALQSIYVNQTETSGFSSSNQPFDTEFYNVGSGLQSTYNLNNFFSKSQLSSYALRLNYSFKDKYLVTFSNRWDGSSLLAEGYKWNAFPSAAVAWRINNEDFLVNSKAVSNLKLRVSYGFTGNNNVSPYSTVNTLDVQTYYDFGGNAANGWVPSSIANKALTWEKTKEINIGLDYGFLNHRINGSIDYYNRLSDELLLDQTLPLETGFTSIVANAGSVRNSGVELMLTTVNVQKGLVSWETVFTFDKNTNKIESIYGQSENDDIGNGWFIGESIDAHYNYKFDGIWQASEADLAEEYNQTEGQAKVVDINNDGQISPDDDRMILGSSNPSWSGGIISRLKVSNFDFNFTIYAKQGVYAYSNFHANFEDMRDRGRQKLNVADWYVPANDYGIPAQASNSYPQPRNGGTFWRNNGVGYYKDASYVKVNNISLGYTLPQSALEKIHVKHLRFYVNVLNPFVFTSYTGWDPEWAEASLNIGRVSNVTTQLGLSLKF
ncbi:SusC/RagA family TonB-linked outer membrane protein [Flexithrix dorotheae]|uniref:SusC/RagA family TonB-linked outer membrane protein n=1 Tax=Flexithrix dorotheae TaxID=70993 RepID=UPI000360909D|nr:TonB-dependent receptor [Flexithrix dorotheae]